MIAALALSLFLAQASPMSNPTEWRAFHIGGDCSVGCTAGFGVLPSVPPGRPWPVVRVLQVGLNALQTLVPANEYIVQPVQQGPDLVIDFKIPISRNDVIYLVLELIMPTSGAK
jgi:hypothetical protein